MSFEVRPVRESELDQYAALHDEGFGARPGTGRFAATRNGMLARPAFVWSTRLRANPEQRRYVVEHDGEVTGYVSYTCRNSPTEWGYRLVVDDFAALDWNSELALWLHLGAHRAQAKWVTVLGVPLDSLALHLAEQTIALVYADHWMLRLVDAAGAIAARGFPPGIEATLPLAIVDARVPANDGDWILEVDGGRGALTRASGPLTGAPPVSITINALAPLFSSACSARTLAAAGLLVGASSEQLATLDALFSGPNPTMNDHF